MNNPDSYYDPPQERIARCECGHEYDDHVTPDDLRRDDLLYALQEIAEVAEKTDFRLLGERAYVQKVRDVLTICLAVCAQCDCRKFTESDDDPKDDGDRAFDSARDAAAERSVSIRKL